MCDNNTYQGQKPPLICKICYKTTNIRRCSRCQTAYYCGNICQRIDWPYHKTECHDSDRKNRKNASTKQIEPETSSAMNMVVSSSKSPSVPVTMKSIANNLPMQQKEVISNNDQCYYTSYTEGSQDSFMFDNSGLNFATIDDPRFSVASSSSSSLSEQLHQQQLQQQNMFQDYCEQQSSSQLQQQIVMSNENINNASQLMDTQQMQQQEKSDEESIVQQSLLLNSLNEMVENGLDIRDELNEIFFGNSEVTDLQLDCEADNQNQLGIGQDNTMHISNENFINNPEFNLPYK